MNLPFLFASAMLLAGGPALAHKSHHHHHHWNYPAHRHYHCHTKKGYCHIHRHTHGGPGEGHHGKKWMHTVGIRDKYHIVPLPQKDKNWHYSEPTFELHIH